MFADLRWGTAIVVTPIFAAGYGMHALANYIAHRMPGVPKVFLVWPCSAIGYLLMGIAGFLMLATFVSGLWRMLGLL